MNYTSALAIANHVILNLRDQCERIEIAGSLRRLKPVVRDIEICVIPKTQMDMFGNPIEDGSLLDAYTWCRLGKLIKGGTRYKQIALHEKINLDLFIILPLAQWGVIFAIRTGPADFSKWIVTPRKYGGCLPSDSQVKDGCVYRHGQLIPMPEEMDFLSFLGLGWIDPSDRKTRN